MPSRVLQILRTGTPAEAGFPFQITEDLHAFPRSPQSDQAIRVLLGLHQKARHRVEPPLEPGADALRAAKRAGGHAPIEHDDGHLLPSRDVDDHRPQL